MFEENKDSAFFLGHNSTYDWMDDVTYNGVPLKEHLKNEKPLAWTPEELLEMAKPDLSKKPGK